MAYIHMYHIEPQDLETQRTRGVVSRVQCEGVTKDLRVSVSWASVHYYCLETSKGFLHSSE